MHSSWQWLLRNLVYFRRNHLTVILGVIAATAAISGAMIVGDSVRASLRQMTLDRLGQIDQAIRPGRFFREDLSAELMQHDPAIAQAAPALMMPGTLEFERSPNDKHRAGQIMVTGCDERLWGLLEHGDIPAPKPGTIVLNERVAGNLSVKVGDTVSLIVEIPSAIPRDALLGERQETIAAQPLKVATILPDELGISRFGLNPTQQLPANAFVSLPDLQNQMGLQAIARSRSQPVARPARVNALFFAMKKDSSDATPLSPETAQQLTSQVNQIWQLADLGLKITDHPEQGYVSLQSEQMFLDESISGPAMKIARYLSLSTSPVLVSLMNEMWKPESPEHYSMYSVVAGCDPVSTAPFGPFKFIGESRPLTGTSIYLNDWLAADLQAKVGDHVNLKYHMVGDRGELPEEERQFTVAGVVELTGPAKDTGFTPEVPGVTDAKTYADWKEPFPLKKDRITDRDDSYWDEYRTTPKMFVSLQTAQELWKSRYGTLTSIRFAPRAGQSLDELKQELGQRLLKELSPAEVGLAVIPVKQQGLAAAQGSTDFTGLFMGFSFFVILSAAILTGLLFRLGLERRLSEIGLLQAIGFPARFVRRMLLAEGMLLVTIGAALGSILAVGYAALMMHGLRTWWNAAVGTPFLFLSVQPASLIIGAVIAVLVAGIAIWWGQRQIQKQPARSLLAGVRVEDLSNGRPWLSFWLTIIAGLGSLGLLVASLTGLIPDVEAFAGFSWKIVAFFLMGVGMLTASLAACSLLLSGLVPFSLSPESGLLIPLQFAIRNASRNRLRSVMTVSLIASATFVIVAVVAGQMNPTGAAPDPQSGNGGFTLVAETNVPVLYDLNTPAGRLKLGFDGESAEQSELLKQAKFASFRVRHGENASCLNLFQARLPTILGVPDDVLENLIADQRFLFADTHAEHPWSLLKEELPDGRVPVLGDMNTLMYSLHKGIGQTIPMDENASPTETLQVVGMLANSVLQGVLLMSESQFQRLFPEEVGFEYFLIEIPPADAPALATLLETQLGDYGFDTESVAQRLADFLAVQNTYLSTFQALGGLGLLLGTFGLATVMLRNVLERASEFSLLQAVGFRRGQVAALVAWENALLLIGGLLIGTVSALLAMSPHLQSAVASIPWGLLLLTLGAVLVIGMLAALIAVRAVVQLPIVETLREE